MPREVAKTRQGPLSPWGLVLLFGFVAAIRVAFTLHAFIGVQGDEVIYVQGAEQYLRSGLLGIEANKGPLYSLLLGIFSQLTGVSPGTDWLWPILNGAFDLGSLLLLVRIGRRLVGGSSIAGVALVAVSPIWWGQINACASEDLCLLVFLAFFERWTRPGRTARDEAWAALLAGLLTLTRAVYVLFPVFIVVFERLWDWVGARFGPRGAPRGSLAGLAATARFLAVSYLMPIGWGLNNLARGQGFVLSGASFQPVMMSWLAMKIPDFDFRLEEHRKFWNDHPFLNNNIAPADIERMKSELFAFIHDHPFRYLAQFPVKIYQLWIGHGWNPFSYIWLPRYLGWMFILCFTIPVLVLGITGAIVVWRRSCAKASGVEAVASWRASTLQIASILYITGVTLPLIVEARFALQAYVILGIWMSVGFRTIFLRGKGDAP